MSYPTTPAFIHNGSWSPTTRSHPAMAFMETYTKTIIHTKAWAKDPSSWKNWITNEHTYERANGEIDHGAQETWSKGLPAVYAPFKEHLHDPQFLVCWEKEGGWEMIGVANVYANLHVPGDGSEAKDSTGKQWDILTKGSFWFEYVKDASNKEHSIKLHSTKVFADATPALMLMLQRGQLKPGDLGL